MVGRNTLRKKIDIEMSLAFKKKEAKTQLEFDKDTHFNVFYDIYDTGNNKYLYIIMEENTATAPFFYNKSYDLEELYQNNIIFRACDSIEDVNDRLNSLFAKKKIKIRYDNTGMETEDDDIIIMEIDATLFATPIKIEFLLYREMVIEKEKDNKLLELYKLNKKNLVKLKEIYSFVNDNKNNKEFVKLVEIFGKYQIPGLEDGIN